MTRASARPGAALPAAATAGTLLVALLCIAASASATTVLPLSDAQLATGADLAVRGTVIEVRTADYAVGPGVFTEAVVAVAERLDGGPAPEEIIVRLPGGQSDTRHVIVPGMPSFAVGDDVVLFLELLPSAPFGDDAPVAFIPRGLEQGVWRPTVGGWERGAQEGLLPVASPPLVRPLGLDALRELF